MEKVVPIFDLMPKADFYKYQNIVNKDINSVASHMTIEQYIRNKGCDYRYEVAPNPLMVLRNRRDDNTSLARIPAMTPKSSVVAGNDYCNCENS